jgi:Na+-translocating ferredoxin:NAD+ oxidoreductase RnfC subunit
MDKNMFLETVKSAGIVGEGGAGFPSHVKYAAEADTVIANGCECEPLLHTDHHIMANHAESVIKALTTLGKVAGATRTVLGLKSKHTDLIPSLRQITEACGVELFLLEDFYPAGDEQILVREVTGRSVPPLGIPLNVGAVVANVGTLADVDAALEGKSYTHKFLTITGEVQNPVVVRAPLGIALSKCLESAGGALPPDPVFIIGGPMMGRVVEGMESLAREKATKTTGGLIVLPAGHPLHKNATLPVALMRKRASSACIQCRACSDLCPRRLIGHPFETHKIMRAFAAGQECSELGTSAVICCECGACEQYACPMGMSPRRVNQAVKASLRQNSITYNGTKELLPDNSLWREFRRIPVARLAARLGIAPYMKLRTPYIGDITTSEVMIPLRQHIGTPSIPIVTVGNPVRVGDCIGEIPDGALCARVHASIDGTVTAVNDNFITISV